MKKKKKKTTVKENKNSEEEKQPGEKKKPQIQKDSNSWRGEMKEKTLSRKNERKNGMALIMHTPTI